MYESYTTWTLFILSTKFNGVDFSYVLPFMFMVVFNILISAIYIDDFKIDYPL